MGNNTREVSIHHFPNATKEPKKHAKWVKFVRKHRPGWIPSETSILCSSHFEDSCFEQNRIIAASLGIKAGLNRDAIPILDNVSEVMQIEKSLSNRKCRKVRIFIYKLNILINLYV